MATEIERKFLLHERPGADVLGRGATLRQGYLAEEGDVEVRLRVEDGVATLTVKAGRGRTRTEVEVPIGPDDAEALWAHTEGRRIDKVRHRVDVDGGVAEVDVYGGDLDGLVVAEVEFDGEAASDAFEPPAWFGPELTGEAGWSNAALARHGAPRRPGA